MRSLLSEGSTDFKTEGSSALGCRERNSAKTRLTTEAQVGMSVTYSGEPEINPGQ